MSPGGLDGLELTTGHALYLDFDGTVTDFGPDPNAIHLDPETLSHLIGLTRALHGAVVMLSGRDVRDLALRTPPEVWRAGGHGLEIVPPGTPLPSQPPGPPDAVTAPLERVTQTDGVWLELKGPVAALHYRAAPQMQDACLAAAREAAGCDKNLVVQAGKMVVEVKPATAHKGTALRRLAQVPPFADRHPVMIGDDTTDEDAMAAAQDLGGTGVKVGEGETFARLRTPDPASVRAWIAREAARLGGGNGG